MDGNKLECMATPERKWPQTPITCHRCRHYYVTWDKNFPFGCRAMEFKGRQMPATVVRRTTGGSCLLYQEKRR